MNAKLTKLMTAIASLDSWTQLSILGSWHYTVNASCINQAMRYIPDVEPESGVDGAGRYEQARIAFIKDAEESNLPGMLAIQREIGTLILNNDGQVRGLENTLDFMTGNRPKRESFEREFEERRRLGMKPGISKKDFVEMEYARALDKHEKLIALGGDAVRLCETVSIMTDGKADGTDIPDWMLESFERKMIEKLHSRWERIELTRTNPRMKKSIRDDAEADQLLIAKLLAEYDEVPGFTGEDPPDPVGEAFDKEAGNLDHVLPRGGLKPSTQPQ